MKKISVYVFFIFVSSMLTGCYQYQSDCADYRTVPTTNNPLLIQDPMKDQIGGLPY